jgi:hypothetical protein
VWVSLKIVMLPFLINESCRFQVRDLGDSLSQDVVSLRDGNGSGSDRID